MSSFFPFVPFLSSHHSHVFRCVAFVHIHSWFCGKLDPRVVKCIFVGYTYNKKKYCCYHLSSRKVFISMNVTLMELNLFLRMSLGRELFWKVSLLNLFSHLLSLSYKNCLIQLLVLLILLLTPLIWISLKLLLIKDFFIPESGSTP